MIGALLVVFGTFVCLAMWLRSSSSSSTTDHNHFRFMTKKQQPNGKMLEGNQRLTVPKSIRDELSKHDLQQILNAQVHLVDVHVDYNELRRHLKNNQFSNENDGAEEEEEEKEEEEEGGGAEESDTGSFPSYNGIYGTFCTLDWQLHKEDPSTYPMFRDLVDSSPQCAKKFRINNVNLFDLVRLAREQDQADPERTRALTLSGVVFHESRCGSTLTANILAAVNPTGHRVYSESPPPIAVLGGSICGDDYSTCSRRVAASILKDVMYLMSRTNRPSEEERVFFKIQSIGSRHLKTFTTAFPHTPYLMVYRDPVQVMMSHLKGGNLRSANCVRARRSPPLSVIKTVKRYTPRTTVQEIRPEDYCAAHLASITETMLHDRTDYGLPINYGILTDTLYNDVLPYWLSIPRLSDAQLATVQGVAAVYSKNRGGNRVEGNFQSDSQKKEEMASAAVRSAAQTYLAPSYNELEQVSKVALERITTIQEQRRASGAFEASE